MTVSRSPVQPLQAAAYRRMIADPPLAGVGIWDHVPEWASRPYVRIGDHLSTPDNDHSGFGRIVTQTVHVWTEARGNLQGQAIAARIVELFDHQPLDVEGHRVVSARAEFDQALTDPDPEIRHHVVRIRFTTAQEDIES